jgi:hypothetical protein
MQPENPPAEGALPQPEDGLPDVPPLVKELADRLSTHAVASNRLWLATMALSLFILPKLSELARSPTSTTDLPWDLGKVLSSHFYFVAALTLSVFSIAFNSAHAQMIRAYRFCSLLVDKGVAEQHSARFHLRDVFDLMTTASFLKIGPLAQLARGRDHQFRHEAPASRMVVAVTATYYLLLKVLATGVYLIFPAAAVWLTWRAYESNGAALAASGDLAKWITRIFVGFALLVFFQTLWTECTHTFRVLRVMHTSKEGWPGSQSPPNSGLQQTPPSRSLGRRS